jgi:hypothetical protein
MRNRRQQSQAPTPKQIKREMNDKNITYGKKSGDSTGSNYHVSKAFLYNGIDAKDFVNDNFQGITSDLDILTVKDLFHIEPRTHH